MTDSRDPICFTCSQPILSPPRFNLLASGDYCPTCRDRVLDAAPSLLPNKSVKPMAKTMALEEPEMEQELVENEGGDYPPDPPLSA